MDRAGTARVRVGAGLHDFLIVGALQTNGPFRLPERISIEAFLIFLYGNHSLG